MTKVKDLVNVYGKATYTYPIGSVVMVDELAYRSITQPVFNKAKNYSESKVTWIQLEYEKGNPFKAIVTGLVQRYDGVMRQYPNGACFLHRSKGPVTKLYEVKRGMLNKPLLVYEEDLELVKEEWVNFPLLCTKKLNRTYWSERCPQKN